MAETPEKYERIYVLSFVMSTMTLLINLYWFCWPIFNAIHCTFSAIDNIVVKLSESGLFLTPYKTKFYALLFIVMAVIVKSGKPLQMSWSKILAILGFGLLCYLMPYMYGWNYLFLSILGYVLTGYSAALIGRKIRKGFDPDSKDTFEQCEKLMETEYSINIPTKYRWKGAWRKGWINIVNPFRATLIMGTPGSGKSYSVYYPYIDQMTKKGMMSFVYDYKFSDLTEIVYNKYLQTYGSYLEIDEKTRLYYIKKDKNGKDVVDDKGNKIPKFCIVNFDDPNYSMRCNPLDPDYLTDIVDATEIADIIMKNVEGKGDKKADDFFKQSAKVYIASLVWTLKLYKDGIYCTFPHLIELMGINYEANFEMMMKDERVKRDTANLIRPFVDAMNNNAQEQLQGQIATARIPLLKFPSATFYWTLTGADFTLDLNNPDDPKIICMGNNPDRQGVYGVALALYTARLFKVINHKKTVEGKRTRPCGVLLDELPTIFIDSLDNLIATARSNRVAIVLGIQDRSQLKRDYGHDNATVIINTVGNVFAGQVNGETAKDLSETFGREWRMQESHTISSGSGSDSINQSYQMQEIVPRSEIETLSQGFFVGRMADNNDCKIDKKLFYGEIQADAKARSEEEKNFKPIPPLGKHYFQEDVILSRIKNNEKAAIQEQIKIELLKEAARQRKSDRYKAVDTPNIAEQKAMEMYKELNDEQKKNYLEKAKKRCIKEDMNRIMQQNYDDIKNDILEMFDYYDVDPDHPSGENKNAGEAAGHDDSTDTRSDVDKAAEEVNRQLAAAKAKAHTDHTATNPINPKEDAGSDNNEDDIEGLDRMIEGIDINDDII